jgi:hypothetical protein
MPAGAQLKFEQETKPITTVQVTASDGVKYEVKLAILVQAVIDSGMTNPIDDVPIFQFVAQTTVQVRRKTNG